jgi:hypothetical protein
MTLFKHTDAIRTLHTDGTITFWSTHHQRWLRVLPRRAARLSPLAWVDSLPAADRAVAFAHEIACGVSADIVVD